MAMCSSCRTRSRERLRAGGDVLERMLVATQDAEAIRNDVPFPLVQADQRFSNEVDQLLPVNLLFLPFGRRIDETGLQPMAAF